MKFLYTAADIAFRAHIDAFLALEAVSGDLYGTIRRQFHGRRALSRAGAAAADAVFTFSVQREKRQDREQGKQLPLVTGNGRKNASQKTYRPGSAGKG